MSRCEEDVLASPPPMTAKSSNKFDSSNWGLSVLTTQTALTDSPCLLPKIMEQKSKATTKVTVRATNYFIVNNGKISNIS